MNLMLLLGAAGLSHSLFGERLLPIGTIYDPFIARGLDALNYACYQDARFLLVGTPSGVSLAGEGGAHQSIGAPLIGMAQDGLAAFEPAFADELAMIIDWAFDYMQRDGEARADLAAGRATCPAARSICGSRPAASSSRRARWTPHSPTASSAAATGCGRRRRNARSRSSIRACSPSEAIEAAGAHWRRPPQRRRARRHLRRPAQRRLARRPARPRARATPAATCHIEALLADLPRHAGLVTVIDGHPATLGWLGGVRGHRTITLGVEHFGQTGTVTDLYAHFGIDAAAIAAAARSFFGGRPMTAAHSFLGRPVARFGPSLLLVNVGRLCQTYVIGPVVGETNGRSNKGDNVNERAA